MKERAKTYNLQQLKWFITLLHAAS